MKKDGRMRRRKEGEEEDEEGMGRGRGGWSRRDSKEEKEEYGRELKKEEGEEEMLSVGGDSEKGEEPSSTRRRWS